MTILQIILTLMIGIGYIIWSILSLVDLYSNYYKFLDQSTQTWMFVTILIIIILTILSFIYGW